MSSSSSDIGRPHGHDTGLYDPTIHDNQIVALYDTDADARAAEATMHAAGFPASSLQVLARDGAAAASGTSDMAQDEGIWGSIKSLFVPDEERTTYNTAIARGHAMLIVTPDRTMDRQHMIHVLEGTNPLDFDAKLEEWRQAGYDTTGAAAGTGLSNTATSGHASDAGSHTAPKTTDTGFATPAAVATPVPATPAPATGSAAPAAAASPVTTPVTTPVAKPATGLDETIKVVEERLRVGKRDVAAGAVRIRSYIVERPVEETVRLHEEHVSIERHPVDRPATTADIAAFQERTIEARATSEEAVIGKEAHVIEEIGVNKTSTDREQTIHDTVRETKVEVEDDAAGKSGTLPANVGGNPNATPDAQTSGANSPRK